MKRQASITFRFEFYPGSTFHRLLDFVLKGKNYPDVPQYPDRFALPLDSFWWAYALYDRKKNWQDAMLAAGGSIRQINRQILLLQHMFPEYSTGTPCPPKEQVVNGKSQLVKTLRFQPRPESKNAILFGWVRSPQTAMMYSAFERVSIALTAYWLPLALKENTAEDALSAVPHSLALLQQQIHDLSRDFYGADGAKPERTAPPCSSHDQPYEREREHIEPEEQEEIGLPPPEELGDTEEDGWDF